ncbi:MAG: hypothetical protein OT477_14790 [Chloroflexi bacterium]|nr:hypothetical protein [Chloroflexota bacterium]
MKTNAEKVAEFHEAMCIPLPNNPRIPLLEESKLALALVREEYREAVNALFVIHAEMAEARPLSNLLIAELMGELADLLYVTYGAMLRWGIDPDVIFNEVHTANMRKTGGPRDANGKILKPEGWVKADLVGLITKIQEQQNAQ